MLCILTWISPLSGWRNGYCLPKQFENNTISRCFFWSWRTQQLCSVMVISFLNLLRQKRWFSYCTETAHIHIHLFFNRLLQRQSMFTTYDSQVFAFVFESWLWLFNSTTSSSISPPCLPSLSSSRVWPSSLIFPSFCNIHLNWGRALVQR